MYTPPAFAIANSERVKDLVEQYSFATIVGIIDGVPHVAYAPTLFLPGGQFGRVQFHLARTNPVTEIGDGAPLILSFLGPHAYISPRWYESPGQVPTWNYIAVEAVGRVHRLSSDELKSQLTLLAAQNERRVPGAEPWALSQLSNDRLEALLSAICGLEVELESLEGKRKLSQNRAAEDAAGAILGLEAGGDCAGLAVADAMKEVWGWPR
jgi:transcriptional regulator